MIRVFEVGGCIRDKIMGLKPKDLDYAVEAPSWEAMREYITERGEIFLETPKYFTIRANIPSLGAADFVLCRKDGEYTDGRHPDTVEIGTIYDDLARRDFTMNAIARDIKTGVILDPFEGQKAIEDKLIICVGEAKDRIREDSLRMLRALRFGVTKHFDIHEDIEDILASDYELLKNVSEDRVREELHKAFKFDTMRTLSYLWKYVELTDFIFSHFNIRLVPKSYP